ncbi:MAG: argininosuccinate lyase, partial [Nitrososphaeria archaeon]|nr:argininosuccinate lyase [Nitrososphaeria archaeon]
RINTDRMKKEAGEGFFASTDLVDYLVQRGVPFREAHQLLGRIVKHCLKMGRR